MGPDSWVRRGASGFFDPEPEKDIRPFSPRDGRLAREAWSWLPQRDSSPGRIAHLTLSSRGPPQHRYFFLGGADGSGGEGSTPTAPGFDSPATPECGAWLALQLESIGQFPRSQ